MTTESQKEARQQAIDLAREIDRLTAEKRREVRRINDHYNSQINLLEDKQAEHVHLVGISESPFVVGDTLVGPGGIKWKVESVSGQIVFEGLDYVVFPVVKMRRYRKDGKLGEPE